MLVARRRLLRQGVATLDVATLIVSLIIAYVTVGVTFHREFTTFRPYAWVLIPIIIIWLVCLSAFGFYRSAAYYSKYAAVTRLVQMEFLASLLLFSLMYLTRSELISRLLLQIFVVVSFTLLGFQK